MKIERQSDVILRLLDAAKEVEESVTQHGPRIARLLEERFAPRYAHLAEGQRPNFLATLFALRDELAASRRKLSADEQRHIELLNQITVQSIERRDLFGSLQDAYTWLRNNFAGFLGARQAEATAGLQGPTAVGTTKLLRQVDVAVRALSKPGLRLPTESLGATTSDPKKIASRLGKQARRLREVWERRQRLHREAQLAMLEKNESVKRHRATLFPVCETLQGYYRLAGEDELADKIRPKIPRRPRRPIQLEPAAEPEAPEAEGADPTPGGESG